MELCSAPLCYLHQIQLWLTKLNEILRIIVHLENLVMLL